MRGSGWPYLSRRSPHRQRSDLQGSASSRKNNLQTKINFMKRQKNYQIFSCN
jgi:hypothetical protein